MFSAASPSMCCSSNSFHRSPDSVPIRLLRHSAALLEATRSYLCSSIISKGLRTFPSMSTYTLLPQLAQAASLLELLHGYTELWWRSEHLDPWDVAWLRCHTVFLTYFAWCLRYQTDTCDSITSFHLLVLHRCLSVRTFVLSNVIRVNFLVDRGDMIYWA